MQIRQVKVSSADILSARVMFKTLTEMFDLSEVHALDMFARTGVLTVESYKNYVHKYDTWELSSEHLPALQALTPNDIQIGCSYKTLSNCKKKYGMIVVDTPQGIHSDWQGETHAEHIDILASMGDIMEDKCIVVLYVNKRPYHKDEHGEQGYDRYEEYDYNEWMAQRMRFYGRSQITEEEAIAAYRRLFEGMGKTIKSVIAVPCFSDVSGYEPYAFRLALEIE